MTTSQIRTISVVIPAFNRARTIKYCLDSVLAQSLQPFEVIVVDDCSTDETVEIVRSFNDNIIRCIVLEKNSGAQAARNRGIREARGEWIAFQDSDDEWLPKKLEKQIAALAEVNFNLMTVVHTDCFRYDHQSGNRTLWELPLIHGASVFSLMLASTGTVFPTILTSKAALEKIGFLDESVPSFQEWDTSIRLARECRFVHIREPLFIYHLHGGETISKNKSREIAGYQYIVDKLRNEILLHCGTEALNEHLICNAIKAKRYGLDTEAYNILGKCSGRPLRIILLKWMMHNNIDPGYYERVFSLFRRLRS